MIVCTRQKNIIYWLYSSSKNVSDRIYPPENIYWLYSPSKNVRDRIYPPENIYWLYSPSKNVSDRIYPPENIYWLYSPSKNVSDRIYPPENIYWLYSPSKNVSDRIIHQTLFNYCISPVNTLVVVFTRQMNVIHWLYSPTESVSHRVYPEEGEKRKKKSITDCICPTKRFTGRVHPADKRCLPTMHWRRHNHLRTVNQTWTLAAFFTFPLSFSTQYSQQTSLTVYS